MGFFDALFGRTRLTKPDMDRLFALSTAAPSLRDAAGLAPDGATGVCLRPVEGSAYARAEEELWDLVRLACRSPDFHTQPEVTRDGLGFTWALFRGADPTEGVALAHLVGTTLQEKGFGEQLLAATFRHHRTDTPPGPPAEGPVYLIYNYKRGRFHPFAPRPGHERDDATEFRLSASLDRLLPMEKDLTRWYALWDCPV